MGAKITGRIEVLLNGVTLLNKSGATAVGISLSGEPNFEVKPILGDTGVHGYTEEPAESCVEVTVTDREDISLDALARIHQDGTVIFRSAGSGKTYTLVEATSARNFSVAGGEGEVAIKYFGNYWTENVQ